MPENQYRPRHRKSEGGFAKRMAGRPKKLLLEEKNFSKLSDELNLQRRKLPWVKVEKEYVFDGPTGR